MKTIGLIGGMSWESSAVYYKLINNAVKTKLGGFNSCKSIMISVDFAEIEALMSKNNWGMLDQIMANAALQLEKAGADIILLCTNTLHLCSPAIIEQISIPFFHIAEATGKELVKSGLKKVSLLGTRFTMEKDFYCKYIKDNYGIDVIIPDFEDREVVHNIIFNELVAGNFQSSSKTKYIEIIEKLRKKGAEGVILGCTEIPLLVTQEDVNIPVFDTTKIHALQAVEWALR
jgi:aspartate racemase